MSASDSDLRLGSAAKELRLGIVDCLNAGFGKLNGVLWVVLFPVLLGLFIWQGPQLSAAPAFNRVINSYLQMLPAEGAESENTHMATAMSSRELIESLAGDNNLFGFLGVGAGIAGRGSLPIAPVSSVGRWETFAPVELPAQALGLMMAIFALGLLLGVFYLGLLAQRVRGEPVDLSRLGQRVVGYWLSIIGFLLLVALGVLVISLPVIFTLGLAFAFAPVAAEMIFWGVVAAWQVAAIWLALFTFFVVDAVVVAELGPLKALRSSIAVVARNFWSAVGFIGLYLLITYGMLALWGQLGDSTLATVVAILGSAYVGTGLAAGSMIYYRTRAAQLPVPGTATPTGGRH